MKYQCVSHLEKHSIILVPLTNVENAFVGGYWGRVDRAPYTNPSCLCMLRFAPQTCLDLLTGSKQTTSYALHAVGEDNDACVVVHLGPVFRDCFRQIML